VNEQRFTGHERQVLERPERRFSRGWQRCRNIPRHRLRLSHRRAEDRELEVGAGQRRAENVVADGDARDDRSERVNPSGRIDSGRDGMAGKRPAKIAATDFDIDRIHARGLDSNTCLARLRLRNIDFA
jgi:hypothetical protein